MKQTNIWVTRGFEGFSHGTCGNAGQNLYISRAGVLQRIHQYDFNKDGYVDLVFCNSQDFGEGPPTYVYRDPLNHATRIELPADGARSGAVADLNGDGYDDLVIGIHFNGVSPELNSFIYYGSPHGFSERQKQELPAPACSSVTVGDFNGDGRPDVAVLCQKQVRWQFLAKAGSSIYREKPPLAERVVRIFYQSELAFEPKRFVDLQIKGEQLAASDLDSDGYADLVVRSKDGEIRVYWGGPDGIDPGKVSQVPSKVDTSKPSTGEQGKESQYFEYAGGATPLARVIHLDGVPHLFVPKTKSVLLVPMGPGRSFGKPLVLACQQAMSIDVGDVNGDGYQDLVLACRQPYEDGECSWIYWGSEEGYDETRRTPLKSYRTCDVVVSDLDGNGFDDIVLCQGGTDETYTVHSLIYRGAEGGTISEPVQLVSEDARRVLLARPSGNKKPDVIFVNRASRGVQGDVAPSIYFGGPDGFSRERRTDVSGRGAVESICCDINDDGYVDLVVANCAENSVGLDPGSFVFFNGPNGFAYKPSITIPTTRAHGVACGDLNRDGYLDLIFGGFNNTELLIFYGTSDGFDTANPERIRMDHNGVLYDDPRWIYLADLNNNGWLDLVVPQISHDRSFILWGGPEGFSMERCQLLSVVAGSCVRAADITGNGYLDLIIGCFMGSGDGPHESFVYIYWNGPDGLREDRRTLLPANAVNSMSLADFNNNGLLDLFICSYHDGKQRDIDSYIYWNKQGRGFSAADRSRLFTHSASGCVAADFNEDGWIDVAIAYHKVEGDHVAHSAVWWNGPDGFVEGNVTRLPTSGPAGMSAVELGNIMDRSPEEYYISSPCNLPKGASVTEISWEAEMSPKTWVKAQLRFANTKEGLVNATWIGPGYGSGWFYNHQKVHAWKYSGNWLQYRLALGAVNSGGTPRVTEVDVYYDTLE